MTTPQADCDPCGTGGTPYEPQQVAEKMTGIPEWELSSDGLSISRNWKFPDFNQAMDFGNGVANFARELNHHPKMTIDYVRVSITLTTHKANGLTEKDFLLAKRIDELTPSPS